jgi:hypothetical protein
LGITRAASHYKGSKSLQEQQVIARAASRKGITRAASRKAQRKELLLHCQELLYMGLYMRE